MKLFHFLGHPRRRVLRRTCLAASAALSAVATVGAQDAQTTDAAQTTQGASQSAQAYPTAAQAQKTSAQRSAASSSRDESVTLRGRIEGFRHFHPQTAQTTGRQDEQQGQQQQRQEAQPSAQQQQKQQQEEQTLIHVRLQDGRTASIALGPKTELDELGLQRNDFVAVQGRAGIVEGVPALIAERIDVNGQRVTIRKDDAAQRHANGKPAQDRSRERGQQQGRPQPVIEADARELLDKVRVAYREVSALQLTGTVTTHIEMGDTVLDTKVGFTSSFQAPNKFRHDTADLLIGSTGEQTFIFNKKTNNYVQQPVAANQLAAEVLPAGAWSVLHAQDPSLLAAALRWPLQRVLESVERVERIDPADIDGRTFPQLVLRGVAGHGPISVLIDPDTYLVRRVKVDLRQPMQKKGEHDRIRQADFVIDYTGINTQPQFEANRFAWQPPEKATAVAQQRAQEEQNGKGLIGKAAPDFQLTSLDGRKVSLADLRGKVVVLDFWASWCPPCQESLPHLGRIYRDQKQDGVEFYAINVGEEKDRIQSFVQMQNLPLPVLLDEDGKVAKQYGVQGIPKTVVIGKDGKVTEVFTGLGQDSYRQIRDAIAKADGGSTRGTDSEGTQPAGKS